MIEIFNPICYSLHTDDVNDKECLKRTFRANDLKTGSEFKIHVCAEYFRLLYDKYRNDKSYRHFASSTLDKAIDEAIGQYVPFWKNSDDNACSWFSKVKGVSPDSFMNIKVIIRILERPERYLYLEILEAFELILENPNSQKLKIETAYSLYDWVKSKTLKKDYKIKEMIENSFNLKSITRKDNFRFGSTFFYDQIDELEFSKMIQYLLSSKL